ncbi:hypothetical protein HVS_10485 [Acetivibrio saccincola]|jgi:hypothetical protein|uniref:Uncharacterized protein n=1 Tax=Acetivibrio saccincola TaxID=1677857 RepID=A0A2K9E2L9_9FIRM|nr:hypothetical protein HVS_10485 [Acetivibrio saccincola]
MQMALYAKNSLENNNLRFCIKQLYKTAWMGSAITNEKKGD